MNPSGQQIKRSNVVQVGVTRCVDSYKRTKAKRRRDSPGNMKEWFKQKRAAVKGN